MILNMKREMMKVNANLDEYSYKESLKDSVVEQLETMEYLYGVLSSYTKRKLRGLFTPENRRTGNSLDAVKSMQDLIQILEKSNTILFDFVEDNDIL